MLDKLIIFVEGAYDKKFFGNAIKPFFETRYKTVTPVEYSQSNKEQVRKIIHTLEAHYDCGYIFTADLHDPQKLAAERRYSTKSDRELIEHINKRIVKLKTRYKIRDANQINFVIIEIESWYLAGISNDYCLENNLPPLNSTDQITKEEFDQIMKRLNKDLDKPLFLDEILGCFDIQKAMTKNKSFRDFLVKYHCRIEAT